MTLNGLYHEGNTHNSNHRSSIRNIINACFPVVGGKTKQKINSKNRAKMKNIEIKKIGLINFKGVRNLEIDFDKSTNIFGDNATGKTTVFDAFTWLMFGKDSTDRKDFEIKTLDKNNVVIPKIEHEVSAIIIVDNEQISIRRILKENWVKKRGSLESEFAGNVTEYYWNEVPMQQKSFQEKVSKILDESVFKMITNPLAFNAMKWQDRRLALIKIAGEVSDQELASGNSEYEKLIAQLVNGKTLEDYRKQIYASIKKAKEDLKSIPTRVDEISKSMPETLDFLKLAVEVESKENQIFKLDAQIADKSKAFDTVLEVNQGKKIKASNLKSEIQEIESKAKIKAKADAAPDNSNLDALRSKLNATTSDLGTAENAIKTLESKISTLENEIVSIDKKVIAKREQWAVENAKELTFDDNDFHCPTCKREFESGDVEGKKTEMLQDFKNRKSTNLSEIQNQGKKISEEKTTTQSEIDALKVRIENGKKQIEILKNTSANQKEALNVELSNSNLNEPKDEVLIYECILSLDQIYKSKKLELIAVEATIEEIPKVDVSDLNTQKQTLKAEIDSIKNQLQTENQIISVKTRIKALENEESTLAQQIANVEKEQFVIENFNKLKIDTLESRINEKFKFVKFRMFELQINGGEIECCDALIDGVPFSDANTASKINAGLDIINTLCEFYQVTAPIFIDNRESIVNVINIQSQIINLIVSEGDKKLRVA